MQTVVDEVGIKLKLVQQANFVSDSPEDVKRKLRELMDAGEIRLRQMEEVTGYKAPTLSQHLSGTYTGDVEKLDAAIVRFYLAWVAKNTIVNTSIVQQIHGFLELAWKRRRIGAIIGPNGRGKTKAINRYAAQNSDYTVVVEVSAVFTPSEMLTKIGDALRITQHMIGTRSERLQAIIRTIQRKPILLIIDQADEVSAKAIKLLRDIHGDDQSRCGVVIVATEKFNELLRSPDLSYMRRRIRMRLPVSDIEYREMKQVAAMWPNNLDEPEMKRIWDWALKDYGVDSVVKLMDMAYDVMLMRNMRKIDSECIEAAFAYL